jgi:hypothetical protein
MGSGKWEGKREISRCRIDVGRSNGGLFDAQWNVLGQGSATVECCEWLWKESEKVVPKGVTYIRFGCGGWEKIFLACAFARGVELLNCTTRICFADYDG